MKLSDIKGERTFDVIADLIDPVCSIAEDPAAAELFRHEALPDGKDPRKAVIRRLRKAVPALMRTHKSDLIAILAAIEGKTNEEYAGALGFPKLIKDIYDLIMDEELAALFISARPEGSSGIAPVTTEAEA